MRNNPHRSRPWPARAEPNESATRREVVGPDFAELAGGRRRESPDDDVGRRVGREVEGGCRVVAIPEGYRPGVTN